MFYFYFYRDKLGVQKIYLKILKLGWSLLDARASEVWK
jgi:hypothetical protein